MARHLLPTLFVLLAACGEPPPDPTPPVDAEALARAYLEAHPRTTIAALGGDHEEKVMPLVGELAAPVLKEVFPAHRFFEFRVSMFSGRLDPKAYVVVSKSGETREILVYRDFGVDPGTLAFFQDEVRFPADAETLAMRFVDACRALRGDPPGGAPDYALQENTGEPTFTIDADGFRATFHEDGRLTDLEMR